MKDALSRCNLKLKDCKFENIFNPSWRVGVGFGSGILLNVLCKKWIVHCKQKHTVLDSLKRNHENDSQKFDWEKFWSYLWPHRWYFLAAIAVRISSVAYYFLSICKVYILFVL